MKRVVVSSFVLAAIAGAVAFSRTGGQPVAGDPQVEKQDRNPWTNLRWNNDDSTFHFAVVSDRTGGHRPRVFSQAVEQLNLLQPAFVMSVGDLIEGYSKDQTTLDKQWKELQSYVNKLEMPFFYVPGNHDMANGTEVADWKERFGRSYYHFVYKNVLFLAVCTDDQGENKGYGEISKEQVEYVRATLKANAGVRWTVVTVHKPVWSINKAKIEGWLEIEKALEGRKYTVFCGHQHYFQKFVRNGMNYYQLSTTGGGSKLRGLSHNEVDHITWVTMKADGPIVSHVLLDGILPENMKPIVTAEEGVPTLNRKPVHPVRGTVTLNGAPLPGAKVVLSLVDGAKSSAVADGYSEGDGSFKLSTYKAWDGAPVGEYVVTVVQRVPMYDDRGLPGANRLPEKYAATKTSDLRASVKTGDNELTLKLMP